MKKILRLACIAVGGVSAFFSMTALSSCSSDSFSESYHAVCPVTSLLVPPPEAPSAPLSSLSADEVEALNRFALRFYLCNSGSYDGNVCVSPLGIASVLGMLANGDDGASRDEILSLLGFECSDAGLAELNRFFRTMTSALPNLDETECVLTNSVWGAPTMPLYRNFTDAVAGSYYARWFGISPAGKSGRQIVNDFVRINTHGLIDDYLESNIGSSLAFLNTAYFKGSWEYPFDESLSEEREFCGVDFHVGNAQYMQDIGSFDYAMADDGTEAVRLPFGKYESNFSMTLIYPSSHINHIPLDEALQGDNLKQLDERFSETVLDLAIPKFDVCMKNVHTLDILRDMGLEKTCDPLSGFPRIVNYPDPFYLDEFIHAARIGINEYGTEGASTSAPSQDNTNSPVSVYLHFDRSFLYMIRENSTGVIIFMGSVKRL